MRWAVIAIVCAGCGRWGYDLRSDASASSDTGAVDDADIANLVDVGMLSGDAAPANACGTTMLLRDDFTDAVPGPLFAAVTANGLTLAEAGGAMTVTFAASVMSGRYAGYRSAALYAAPELCAVGEVQTVPAGEGVAYIKLVGASDQIEFFEHGGVLDLRTHVGNNVSVVATVPFDLVAMRYLRLRHHAGVAHWETSADGSAFIDQATAVAFTDATARLELGAGAYVTVTNANQATFASARLIAP